MWEARLLGAHSPRVLLNTLVYFNTKYFMLQTAENHLALSFSNILKQWKKNSTIDGKPIRSVYLRYNTVGFSPSQTGDYYSLFITRMKHILIECVDLNDVRNKHFVAYSIKDVFDNVEAQKNIDFIEETCFYKQL